MKRLTLPLLLCLLHGSAVGQPVLVADDLPKLAAVQLETGTTMRHNGWAGMLGAAAFGGFVAVAGSTQAARSFGAGIALCGLSYNVTLHVKANANTKRAIRYLRLNHNQ